MITLLTPPRVVHRGGKLSDNRAALCKQCGAALHMSKGESALLQYYATCQNGYTPSLQSIANVLKIDRRTVQRCRTMLVEHGCIELTKQFVFIDWFRIRTFATLDPSMTCKHAIIAPASPRNRTADKYLGAVPLDEAVATFAYMKDEEYEKWRTWLRQFNQRLSKLFKAENKRKDEVDIVEEMYEAAI
jgi:hypothetical protein